MYSNQTYGDNTAFQALALAGKRREYGDINLSQRMQIAQVPTLSIGVMKNYQTIFTTIIGDRSENANESLAVTGSFDFDFGGNDIYQVASISKPVFMAAVLRIVQAGKIALDDDVSAYFPQGFALEYEGDYVPITLRQLLSHTSGSNLPGFEGYKPNEQLPTIAQILKGEPPSHDEALTLIHKPGTQVSYSGGGYLLAQAVITKLLDQNFTNIMQEWILKPCEMKDSFYGTQIPIEKQNRCIFGHRKNPLTLLEGGYQRMPELAAAGLWSTPGDLMKFGRQITRALAGNTQLFSQGLIEYALSPILPQTNDNFAIKEPTNVMGTGFFLNKEWFYHSGSNPGYTCEMRFSRKGGNGLAVLCNGDQAQDFLKEIFLVLDDLFECNSSEYR